MYQPIMILPCILTCLSSTEVLIICAMTVGVVLLVRNSEITVPSSRNRKYLQWVTQWAWLVFLSRSFYYYLRYWCLQLQIPLKCRRGQRKQRSLYPLNVVRYDKSGFWTSISRPQTYFLRLFLIALRVLGPNYLPCLCMYSRTYSNRHGSGSLCFTFSNKFTHSVRQQTPKYSDKQTLATRGPLAPREAIEYGSKQPQIYSSRSLGIQRKNLKAVNSKVLASVWTAGLAYCSSYLLSKLASMTCAFSGLARRVLAIEPGERVSLAMVSTFSVLDTLSSQKSQITSMSDLCRKGNRRCSSLISDDYYLRMSVCLARIFILFNLLLIHMLSSAKYLQKSSIFFDIPMKPLHFGFLLLIEFVLQISDRPLDCEIVHRRHSLHEAGVVQAQFQCPEHSLQLINQALYQLLLVNGAWHEGDLTIGVDNFGHNVRIGLLILLVQGFELLYKLLGTSDPEVLVQQATVRLLLQAFDQVHLVEDVDMRQLQVDHCRQGHHAKRDKLVDIVHVGAVEQLNNAGAGAVVFSNQFVDFYDGVSDGVGVKVELDLAGQVEDEDVRGQLRRCCGFLGLGDYGSELVLQPVQVLIQEIHGVQDGAVWSQLVLLHDIFNCNQLIDLNVLALGQVVAGVQGHQGDCVLTEYFLVVFSQQSRQRGLARPRRPHYIQCLHSYYEFPAITKVTFYINYP